MLNVYDVSGWSELWYNTDIDVTNDKAKYEESGTNRKYKSIAANTSWYGTDTYQLGDNLMYRSDKLLPSSFLRYNRVRSTYVNIPVNNRIETRYKYEDVSANRFNNEFPQPTPRTETYKEKVEKEEYWGPVAIESGWTPGLSINRTTNDGRPLRLGGIEGYNDYNGTHFTIYSGYVINTVEETRTRIYRDYYTLNNNGSYYYVTLHKVIIENNVEKSHTTQIVKYYNQQVPYNVTVPGTATPIMYGDYVYTSHLETRTKEVTPSYWVVEMVDGINHQNSFSRGDIAGPFASFEEAWDAYPKDHSEYCTVYIVTRNTPVRVPYQVTVYVPSYIPGIIATNNFKWVDIARYLYDNKKLVRGQYNIGAYSSYANIYNNTPYYATDVSENRRSTYHNGVRSLWPRTASILFEKSAGQTEPYPQPNITYIGNLTNNKTHFNSLSEAKYA